MGRTRINKSRAINNAFYDMQTIAIDLHDWFIIYYKID